MPDLHAASSFMRFARRAIGAVAIALSLSVSPAAAQQSSKYAGIVVDVKTGKTLYSASADELRFPASLTKIMTLYIVFEELEAGRLRMDTPSRFHLMRQHVRPQSLVCGPAPRLRSRMPSWRW